MEILITLLVLALVVVIAYYVIDLLALPAPIGHIVKIIIGLIVLIRILQLVGVNLGPIHL